MNIPTEDSSFSDLKQEVEALRKRMEEMESAQARSAIAGRAKGGRRLFRNPVLAVPLVAIGAVLTLAMLGAQSTQPDALFINPSGNVGIGTRIPGFPLSFSDKIGDKIALSGQTGSHYGFGIQDKLLQIHTTDNKSDIAFGYGSSGSFTPTMQIKGTGNVGIGTTAPTAMLDVTGTSRFKGGVGINTAPLTNQNLVITPTDGNVPFNVTDPGGGVNWLSVMRDGNVLMNGANVGIGTITPTARLDVKGEIKGKPWVSQQFEWKQQGKNTPPATRLTKADHTVCFLTFVSGKFYGAGEVVEITQSGGYWMLGGKAGSEFAQAKARCIGAPDDSW
jgi:hypothetical protein